MSGKLVHMQDHAGQPDEAECWFVRLLEPDCTDDDRAAFDRWYSTSPEHARAYREVERLWVLGADAVKDPAVIAAAELALRETRPEARRRRPRWFVPAMAAAAVLVAALVVVPRWLASHMTPDGTRYATTIGQMRSVNLDDGSTILLDTDSVVVERYNADVRRVDLLHGKAQFHVQGNKAWPFVVHAQNGTVTAVGTRFQVRVNDDAAIVTLLEGRLSIATRSSSGQQSASLSAAEQLKFDSSGVIGPVHPADMQAAEGWTEGKLFVHDWLLPDLLSEMNRYSSVEVRIADPLLRTVRISGVFRAGDQQGLLLALQKGWSIRAERASSTLFLLSHK